MIDDILKIEYPTVVESQMCERAPKSGAVQRQSNAPPNSFKNNQGFQADAPLMAWHRYFTTITVVVLYTCITHNPRLLSSRPPFIFSPPFIIIFWKSSDLSSTHSTFASPDFDFDITRFFLELAMIRCPGSRLAPQSVLAHLRSFQPRPMNRPPHP